MRFGVTMLWILNVLERPRGWPTGKLERYTREWREYNPVKSLLDSSNDNREPRATFKETVAGGMMEVTRADSRRPLWEVVWNPAMI